MVEIISEMASRALLAQLNSVSRHVPGFLRLSRVLSHALSESLPCCTPTSLCILTATFSHKRLPRFGQEIVLSSFSYSSCLQRYFNSLEVGLTHAASGHNRSSEV